MNIRSRHPFAAHGSDVFALAAAELEILHRRRERVPSDRLSDQQWGILLELFVAHEAGRPMQTTALRLAAGAPHSTLVRLLDGLAARGLVERERSAPDRRVTLVRPTEQARLMVAAVFDDDGEHAA